MAQTKQIPFFHLGHMANFIFSSVAGCKRYTKFIWEIRVIRDEDYKSKTLGFSGLTQPWSKVSASSSQFFTLPFSSPAPLASNQIAGTLCNLQQKSFRNLLDEIGK